MPGNLVVTVAGQRSLDPNRWGDYLPVWGGHLGSALHEGVDAVGDPVAAPSSGS